LLYSHFVRREILLVVIACAAPSGCGWQPGVYAVPPQRSLDLGLDPGGLGPFIAMDDPIAPDYIVRDISDERGFRRWAFVHPELRFRVRQTGHLKFAAEFAIPEVTFKVTGPVTVSCAVNGRVLGSIRCPHAGDFRLEADVPAGVVEPNKEAHVTFEAHPRWISPDDGAQLSFFLRSAGFLDATP
jgi:hypothetical protein